jgi:hypothetical protein
MDTEYGPCMMALSERERKFVLAMASDPEGNATEWARMAGYGDNGGGGIRVTAHDLIHRERVQAAALEFSKGLMTTVGPLLATNVMLRKAAGNGKEALRAAEMIANRVGLHEVQELTVTRKDETLEAKIGQIRQLAELLGIAPRELLGANNVRTIDHKVAGGVGSDNQGVRGRRRAQKLRRADNVLPAVQEAAGVSGSGGGQEGEATDSGEPER